MPTLAVPPVAPALPPMASVATVPTLPWAPVVSPAVWRVKEKFKPCSNQSVGFYFQVATKNMAGLTAMRTSCMSFEKPYKLENDRVITSKEDVTRALAALKGRYILSEHLK